MKTWCLWFLSAAFVSGFSPSFPRSATAQQVTEKVQAVAEPTAPKPLPEVQAILEKTREFEDAKEFEEVLKTADQALEVARQRHDAVGEAAAQQARAEGLQDLKRTDEAVAAWGDAMHASMRADDRPSQVEALVNSGLLFLNSGKHAEAENLFSQALALGKGETGRPLAASQALYQAGNALYEARYRSKRLLLSWAGDFLAAALVIREDVAPESLELIEILNALGNVCNAKRDLTVAEQYLNRAHTLGEREAPNSLAVAHTLDGLGWLEHLRDNLAASATYYERALAFKERVVPDSLDLAETLEGLGNNSYAQDLFAAERFHKRALEIREKLDPDSVGVAYCLNNLGIVAHGRGDLAAARYYLTRSLSIEEKLLGPDSLDTSMQIINLGNVAQDEGDYGTARRYFERALATYEKVSPDSGGVPVALSNLGNLAYEQGDLSSALQYNKRALAIDEKRAKPLSVAEDLANLGEVFRARGAQPEAETYYRRALEIREKHAPESLDLASSYQNVAELTSASGNLSGALEYQRKALLIRQKIAPGSLAVASSLHGLGELAYEQVDLPASEKYHLGALAIRERTLGPMHPDVARSLNALALVLAAGGSGAIALEAALRAENISREHLRLTARSLSERQALRYASVRSSGLDLSLSLTASKNNSSDARDVFDSLIRSRALVFDEMAARHRTTHETENPDITYLAQQVLSARTRLAALVVRGIGDSSPEVYRKLLDEAADEKERSEQALAEKSISFRHEQASNRVGLPEVAASLPASSILVSFVRYNRYSARYVPKKSFTITPSYLALVMRAGTANLVVVPLGAAKEIDSLIANWQNQMAKEAIWSGTPYQRRETAYRKVAWVLRKKIWDPVAAHLGSTRRIFVVPDGALHLVNLASLPIGDSGYLIERGPLIHYLAAERDLVPFGMREEGKGLLALGAPAFDEAKLFASLAPKQLASELPAEMPAVSHAFRGTRSTCGTFQSMRFEPLPASAREVRDVAALWPARGGAQSDKEFRGQQYRDSVVELRGAAASEAALKQLVQGKRVLHLATHGFFLGGRCTSALDAKATEFGDSTPAIGDNPLLLSGLAMAGANHRDAAGPDEEDGILTAEEIASLDLNGVDWAVLSACDTGVGEIKAGEGVFGLRRAFQVAGARTVIMSLWQVEDQATRQWMTALYKNRFQRGLGTAESVRAASLQLLSQRRAAGQSTHPFYWAGFIATGDWR